MTLQEWREEGRKLFGDDEMQWRFICPSCKHVTRVQDWKDAGAPETAVAFSCVGRWSGAEDSATFQGRGGPCQYAGGGLIGLNPVRIDGRKDGVFAFATQEAPHA